ncbi:TPA: hypothetical protein HA259_06185, partial [Thermoplasmata archaeon]|nr:hypothetical protein [Thermoplasmata archaeon]
MEIGTNIALGSQSLTVLCARHTNVSEDWTEVNFGPGGAAVRVHEGHPASPVTAGSTDELMLTVKVSVKGPPVTVTGLRFEALGNATASSLEAIESYRSLGTGRAGMIEFEDALTLREGNPLKVDILASFHSDYLSDTYGLRL